MIVTGFLSVTANRNIPGPSLEYLWNIRGTGSSWSATLECRDRSPKMPGSLVAYPVPKYMSIGQLTPKSPASAADRPRCLNLHSFRTLFALFSQSCRTLTPRRATPTLSPDRTSGSGFNPINNIKE